MRFTGLLLLVLWAAPGMAQQPAAYYPEAHWQRKSPAEAGINSYLLKEAIDFAVANEARAPRDQRLGQQRTFGREPHGEAVGPFAERGDQTGVVVHRGYIVAEWGEPSRVDMTHSVTKSFVSAVTGLAFDRGLIKSLGDPVHSYVPALQPHDPKAETSAAVMLTPFDSAHNRRITWNHLLRQTSDWEGTLWGKPDWADRPETNPPHPPARARHAPGAVYKYNDVRVNVLALAALSVWRRPLPEVLKQHIMDVIGASNTWRWTGYDTSWIMLEGKPVQSVSGGGHWGGGMFINAYDMARFGLLTQRRGKWKDRQLLSEQWIAWSLTPTPVQPNYGFMNWYLNTGKRLLPSAPASAFQHVGNGLNAIYVDAENDVVAVVRWIDNAAMDEFVKRMLAALPNR